MSSSRVFAIFLLFAVSGSVLVFVGIHWIIDFHAISATSDPSSYMVLLLSLATLSLATLYAIHYGARRLLIWAMARRHIPTIRFFQRVAPRFTRKVLESLLGTSIVLSSAVAANAAPVTPWKTTPPLKAQRRTWIHNDQNLNNEAFPMLSGSPNKSAFQ
ncbi:hypothetical protein [Glutamicibacter sp. M10]|uniref:hypothetical protein n=1 Tax=Glutamicibacter sp. M10 TaxID=3023076 RepID=UPI0021C5D288|nr:hypothetical protein [Glutamicibacter sp. M10]UXN30646.1 hypothetical protein N6V40_09210 [Glutamicibacter sp. M10]